MDKQKALAKLVLDLQAFLQVLDSENLSYIAQAQKKSISELLSTLQDKDFPADDAEYMIMNCPSGDRPDPRQTSFIEVHSTEEPLSLISTERMQTRSSPTLPPAPTSGLDAEDCYEEAEPYPASNSTGKADSESSHYESYGDEEEEEEEFGKDKAHYIHLSSSQPFLRPAPESRICGYLWRKKWLGQWIRQLCIIKHNSLLCFKSAKDLHPLLDLNLKGCSVVYKYKQNKKMPHELKLVTGAETVVLGFQNSMQATEWRKIIDEVSGSYYEPQSQSSSSILKSDMLELSRSSSALHSDSDEEHTSSLPSAISSLDIKDKERAASLNVLMHFQWQSLWCRVEDGCLKMSRDEESVDSPQYKVQLRGSEIRPGPDTAHAYRISISKHGDHVAVLEVKCADDKEKWVQLLQDGSSSGTEPLHQHTNHDSLCGLKSPSFHSSNMYMDNPFQQMCRTIHSQPIYSNSSILEHMFQKPCTDGNGEVVSLKGSSNYSNTEIFSSHSMRECRTERCVQKLELTGKRWTHLGTGSELNLMSVGSKPAKQNSFRQSLALCTERAQGGFLNLRRTASAKITLKKAPSALFFDQGKVFKNRKVRTYSAPALALICVTPFKV
ncbi:hypothetical protein DNTS_013768 [Danionella cerebrum]|uniref:PH domain-containing protein n=1 Tax=Danionella cerebrum TaxID=2873325 RepID=A0A553NIU0_9TELE|nr:hypothetical protein DNTS_013768 [Danionella translucida]